MGLLPDLGISEKLRKVSNSGGLGASAAAYLASKIERPRDAMYFPMDEAGKGRLFNDSPGGQVLGASDTKSFADLSKEANQKSGYTGSGSSAPASKTTKTANLSQTAKNAASKAAKSAAADAIGRSWKDQGDYMDQVKNDVNGLSGTISGLGAARDSIVSAYDRQLQAKKDAIEGNRQLIQKNQNNDMRDLGDSVRKSIFNSNISLGAAANSSASEAASKAIQAAAGKNRQTILTGYGDKISAENQNEKNAYDTYQLNRKSAYDWEDRQRNDLIAKFNSEKAVIDRLMKQAPDWKKEDLASESEKNLQKMLNGLQQVSAEARSYRDYIAGLIEQANNTAVATDQESIGIDKPAALDTPEFTDKLNIPAEDQTDPNATDFYNPKVTGKKRYGTDIFGNPLTFDEANA